MKVPGHFIDFGLWEWDFEVTELKTHPNVEYALIDSAVF